MKISALETIHLPEFPSFLFIAVHTDEGLIGWCKSEYSLLISADDLITPGCLWRATQVLERHPEASMAYGQAQIFYDEDYPVLQPVPGVALDPDDVVAFVKSRIGSVKSPKQVEVWPDLPRSKVGKVLKAEIRQTLSAARALLGKSPELEELASHCGR